MIPRKNQLCNYMVQVDMSYNNILLTKSENGSGVKVENKTKTTKEKL